MPDVDMLAATKTGRVTGLDLSVRPRETNYAMAFAGYIEVPTDGDYEFYLRTDAGALFRVHDATVIDDDFTHNGSEVSASIRLKAGLHPFRLVYRHATGAAILDLKYSGPGIPKQPVPVKALNAACAGQTEQGFAELKSLTEHDLVSHDLRKRLRPFLYA